MRTCFKTFWNLGGRVGDLQQSAGKMGRSTKEIPWEHESFSKTMIHQDNSWISTVFGDRATARGVVHAVAF